MAAGLEIHDRVLREAIDSHGGFVFATGGDSFSAAFSSPTMALSAAVEPQTAHSRRCIASTTSLGSHRQGRVLALLFMPTRESLTLGEAQSSPGGLPARFTSRDRGGSSTVDSQLPDPRRRSRPGSAVIRVLRCRCVNIFDC